MSSSAETAMPRMSSPTTKVATELASTTGPSARTRYGLGQDALGGSWIVREKRRENGREK